MLQRDVRAKYFFARLATSDDLLMCFFFSRFRIFVSLRSTPHPPPSCSFNGLGVKLSNPDDDDSVEKLALVMFDTRTIKG